MEDSQQHQIKDLASAEENIPTSRETTPLLGNERRRTRTRMQSKFHCRRQRCCVSSKAALLILVWNLILAASFESILDPNFFRTVFEIDDDFDEIKPFSAMMYSVVAFLFLFYPLAGCLADIRWGRYKTVVYSVRVIWGSLVAMVVFAGVAVASILIPDVFMNPQAFSSNIRLVMMVVVSVVFGIPTLVALLLISFGLICFSANVIQYGMDQLHDAPMEDSILYVHWYVWTSYAGLLPMGIGFHIDWIASITFGTCLIFLTLLFLGITLCIQRNKQQWFS
jgi:hypothetical protein